MSSSAEGCVQIFAIEHIGQETDAYGFGAALGPRFSGMQPFDLEIGDKSQNQGRQQIQRIDTRSRIEKGKQAALNLGHENIETHTFNPTRTAPWPGVAGFTEV